MASPSPEQRHAGLDPEVVPIFDNIQGIFHKLQKMKEGKGNTIQDIQHYQQMLDAIDSKRVDGIFGGSLEGKIPEGQAACREVLDDAYDTLFELIETAEDMNPDMKQIYNTLKGIHRKLLEMKFYRNYTHEDIHHYQLMVDAIDGRRKDGIFAGSLEHIPAGQAQCSSILAKCYDLLQQVLPTAKKMNPEMRALLNSLNDIKSNLQKLADNKAGAHTFDDLRPFQEKLNDIDSKRKEGVFLGSPQTHIPPGQAICSSVLNQCYKLIKVLQHSAKDSIVGEKEKAQPNA